MTYVGLIDIGLNPDPVGVVDQEYRGTLFYISARIDMYLIDHGAARRADMHLLQSAVRLFNFDRGLVDIPVDDRKPGSEQLFPPSRVSKFFGSPQIDGDAGLDIA